MNSYLEKFYNNNPASRNNEQGYVVPMCEWIREQLITCTAQYIAAVEDSENKLEISIKPFHELRDKLIALLNFPELKEQLMQKHIEQLDAEGEENNLYRLGKIEDCFRAYSLMTITRMGLNQPTTWDIKSSENITLPGDPVYTNIPRLLILMLFEFNLIKQSDPTTIYRALLNTMSYLVMFRIPN